ncbi:MAG: histone family protein [Candidatus Altiarchaeota archaeon]|nr:histone family protein [Candidatus Altiarchaeota archaeon]
MTELPLAPIERVMRKAGAERVSSGAVKAVADEMEVLIEELTVESIKLSKHAGRKTITREDIELASERLY